MEAQAAGLHIVCSEYGALTETVRRGTIVRGDPSTAEWRGEFVKQSVRALTRGDDDERVEIMATIRKRYSWDMIAEEWLGMIGELLAEETEIVWR
jgi:hypothetical protein